LNAVDLNLENRIWAQPSVAKWTALAEQSIAVPRYDALL
jgi:hypothetical protein